MAKLLKGLHPEAIMQMLQNGATVPSISRIIASIMVLSLSQNERALDMLTSTLTFC